MRLGRVGCRRRKRFRSGGGVYIDQMHARRAERAMMAWVQHEDGCKVSISLVSSKQWTVGYDFLMPLSWTDRQGVGRYICRTGGRPCKWLLVELEIPSLLVASCFFLQQGVGKCFSFRPVGVVAVSFRPIRSCGMQGGRSTNQLPR